MSAAPDPIAELVADRERARAAGDPLTDLCILATHDPGDPGGAPGVRTLVLRDTGPQGIGLLVSGKSPKWGPLGAGRFECLLAWRAIRRQYRIRGALSPMAEARVQEYWEQKVHTSRLLDVYYDRIQPQSSPVASRQAFLDGIESLRQAHPTPDAVPRPDLLRGVYLVPERIEIWRGSPDRLHDRRRFHREGATWRVEVLIP